MHIHITSTQHKFGNKIALIEIEMCEVSYKTLAKHCLSVQIVLKKQIITRGDPSVDPEWCK